MNVVLLKICTSHINNCTFKITTKKGFLLRGNLSRWDGNAAITTTRLQMVDVFLLWATLSVNRYMPYLL